MPTMILNHPITPNAPPKIPLIHALEDLQTLANVDMEPEAHELEGCTWIEIASREWSDEKLLDDARPGRRKRLVCVDSFARSNELDWGCASSEGIQETDDAVRIERANFEAKRGKRCGGGSEGLGESCGGGCRDARSKESSANPKKYALHDGRAPQ